MIHIKSQREIEAMKASSEILGKAHHKAASMIKAGVSTHAIDMAIHEVIVSHGATPSFLDYRGYPASSCISINDVVIHGIPSAHEKLQEGDIVSIDIGVHYNGYHSDCARTYPVGQVSEEHQKLMDVTRQSFYEGLHFAKAGNRLGDLSHAIQAYVEQHSMTVVKEFTGHGVGKELHEDPAVPNYGMAGKGVLLRPGMTLAVEPMVNLGSASIKIMPDQWTVKTVDGAYSSHFEQTILITDDEPVILTDF